MRVISNKALKDFAAEHPAADAPLQAWRRLIETGSYASFAALKATFNATDRVQSFYVFDIGGNKFRVITAIHFNTQTLYVRYVMTHGQYDKWNRSR